MIARCVIDVISQLGSFQRPKYTKNATLTYFHCGNWLKYRCWLDQINWKMFRAISIVHEIKKTNNPILTNALASNSNPRNTAESGRTEVHLYLSAVFCLKCPKCHKIVPTPSPYVVPSLRITACHIVVAVGPLYRTGRKNPYWRRPELRRGVVVATDWSMSSRGCRI